MAITGSTASENSAKGSGRSIGTRPESSPSKGDAVDTPNGPGLYWRSDSDGRHRVWHGSECRAYELNELMVTNVHEATE